MPEKMNEEQDPTAHALRELIYIQEMFQTLKSIESRGTTPSIEKLSTAYEAVVNVIIGHERMYSAALKEVADEKTKNAHMQALDGKILQIMTWAAILNREEQTDLSTRLACEKFITQFREMPWGKRLEDKTYFRTCFPFKEKELIAAGYEWLYNDQQA